MEQYAGVLDVTPTKGLYRSIISDYSLRTGICELVDNAVDQWTRDNRSWQLKVAITVRLDQHTIQVFDNAGGVSTDDLKLLVTPGDSSATGTEEIIGNFGVGSKRAVVALAESVEIRTRRGTGSTFLIRFDNAWLKEQDWHLRYFKVESIPEGSTIIDLSRLRFDVDAEQLGLLSEHLRMTYALLLTAHNFSLTLNGDPVEPLLFDSWSYPPESLPHEFQGNLPTEDGQTIKFRALAGLSNEQGSIAGEYGVYFYCNDRLVAKRVQNPEVGFVAGLAGAPHNVVSLVRVIVFLNGPAECMPWNSSKSAIGFNHRTFTAMQKWLRSTVASFAAVCKRLHGDWDDRVFSYTTGQLVPMVVEDFEQIRRSYLPPLPSKRVRYATALQRLNEGVLDRKPWTRGLVDADIAVELIERQELDQGNRLALILIDSVLEIAYKDFLVHEVKNQFFSNVQLVQMFGKRHEVEKEIKKHIQFPATKWAKLKFYYGLRCSLIHERSGAEIKDKDIAEFKKLAHQMLSKLFKLRWPKAA